MKREGTRDSVPYTRLSYGRLKKPTNATTIVPLAAILEVRPSFPIRKLPRTHRGEEEGDRRIRSDKFAEKNSSKLPRKKRVELSTD